jgi:hypothetical protein
MVNEYTPNNTQPKLMIFDQTKTSNVLDVAGDYYLSVIRWNLQCNLPLIVPDMELYPNDPLAHYTGITNYKVALLYTTNSGGTWNNPSGGTGVSLIYQPETTSPKILSYIPAPKNKEDVLNNPYYYIRNADTFLKMINDAIVSFIGTVAGMAWTNPPYFQWDANAGKIVFNVPNGAPTGVAGVDATTKWYVALNQPLYNLLSTFKTQFYPDNSGNTTFPNITCRYVIDTDILKQGDGNYTPYYQQSSSVVNWSPCQSIVFVSSTIPVEPQFSGAPVNLNNTDPSTQSSIYQQQSTTKILTDFILPLTSGVEYVNSVVSYIPQSEYRLIDLLGNSAMNQLTIQVFWRDKYGSFHPMSLDAGGSADVLILLRKKSFNRQNTK